MSSGRWNGSTRLLLVFICFALVTTQLLSLGGGILGVVPRRGVRP